ncbi:hypothetical protein BCR35DRAFT_140909 [Leucosporidium creatinivorum]|uniref:Uncharacterized protein n=1 Tax=Leucosporidium creatinivorum TaxID=106004 RepID=A0A1Y2EUK2_9BASI|nr:hypothetical protein BCR35DRAFT_140909 [Leucosporidium creatinivorum]
MYQSRKLCTPSLSRGGSADLSAEVRWALLSRDEDVQSSRAPTRVRLHAAPGGFDAAVGAAAEHRATRSLSQRDLSPTSTSVWKRCGRSARSLISPLLRYELLALQLSRTLQLFRTLKRPATLRRRVAERFLDDVERIADRPRSSLLLCLLRSAPCRAQGSTQRKATRPHPRRWSLRLSRRGGGSPFTSKVQSFSTQINFQPFASSLAVPASCRGEFDVLAAIALGLALQV